jgi:hypothetical protein
LADAGIGLGRDLARNGEIIAFWENKMMQKTVHCSAIVAITWLLSVAVLISAAQFDVAQAKKGRAAGCGKELVVEMQCSIAKPSPRVKAIFSDA